MARYTSAVIRPYTVVPGPYANLGTATGTDGFVTVTDYDPAYHTEKMSPPNTITIAAIATGVRIELFLGSFAGSGGCTQFDTRRSYTAAVSGQRPSRGD